TASSAILSNAMGVFNWTSTNLLPGTKYYFRAKAHNSAGWGYGNERSFTTSPNNALPVASSLSQGIYCGDSQQFYFRWSFSDAEDGINQTSYQIKIYKGSTFDDFPTLILDSGRIDSSSKERQVEISKTLFGKGKTSSSGQLSYGTQYYWQIKVWDSAGNSSSGWKQSSFMTPAHPYPQPIFSIQASVLMDETVTTTNATQCYGLLNKPKACTGYLWTVNGSSGPDSAWEFAGGTTKTSSEPKFIFHSTGNYAVMLEATDSDSYACLYSNSVLVSVETTLPLPTWREIPPN
ncbi:MAG: hypothetical protein WCX77_03875, partial [Candidatus Paceibacterota bacterium]